MKTANLQTFRDLDTLHLSLLADVKNGGPIWEDIIGKSGKLFTALRATAHASNAFLDAIQRLADLASKTSGGSKEIGAHFTRLCMRQKRLGTKVKTMGNQLITCIVNPLTSHMEDWRKNVTQIEKEHNREAKRAQGELKRALSEANRLKRKLAKQENEGTSRNRQGNGSSTIGQGVGLGEPPVSSRLVSSTVSSGIGTSSLAVRTDSAVRVLEQKVCRMEDLEKATIRRLMLEERGRYCFFFNCMRPVLETELSLLGEISTLRELFTALSETVEDPSRLLAEAESVLAHAAATVGPRTCVSVNGPPHSFGTNEVEAFASAVDAIMASHQCRQRSHGCYEATPSVASVRLCSSSSERSTNSDLVKAIGLANSPDSNRMSIHSAGSDVFAPQQQFMSLLRQSRVQNDNGPRSASLGRATINWASEHIVHSNDVKEVVLRRPTIDGACVIPVSARQRPRIIPSSAMETSNRFTTTAISNQRNSTCTLQQLNDIIVPSNSQGSAMRSDDRTDVKKNKNEVEGGEGEEEEEEEETTSDTLGDDTSDDGAPASESIPSRKDGRSSVSGTDELHRSLLSSVPTTPSRGDFQTMLYPDQSLPPPVYTNLNKLTHAAQRKFSMSSTMAPNGAVDASVTWQLIDERDSLSIASEPQIQSDSTMTKGGIYSVPALPCRPSFPTTSSNSRPSLEDPFSVEMDELDCMISGSSPASSVTSRSGTSCIQHLPSQSPSHPLTCLNHSTGIPIGLLRTSKSSTPNNPTDLHVNRSRSSSLCVSSATTSMLNDFQTDGTSMNTCISVNRLTPSQPTNGRPTSAFSHNGSDSMVDVNNPTKQVPFTAASLLTQLSGQLQQLGSSNTASMLKHSPNAERNMSAEFDLPAPPSPQIPNLFTHI